MLLPSLFLARCAELKQALFALDQSGQTFVCANDPPRCPLVGERCNLFESSYFSFLWGPCPTRSRGSLLKLPRFGLAKLWKRLVWFGVDYYQLHDVAPPQPSDSARLLVELTSTMSLALLADAGLPMIFLTFPAMLMLLIPVIVIEGLLCKKWLGLTTVEAMKSNAVSNLASTIIGVPVAWAIMFGVEFITFGIIERSNAIQHWRSPIAQMIWLFLGSAWIGPPSEKNIWVIPAATLVLLVPFFLASYGVEYLVVRHMVGMPEGGPPNLAYSRVRIAVRNANLITYGAMFVATSVWLVFSFVSH